MAAKPLPSIERLRQLLRYEPSTGKLYWLPRKSSSFATYTAFKTWQARCEGKEAFTADGGRGYKLSAIDGKMLKAHRVAWAIHYGFWPDGMIDHINQNRADNRIDNLRVSDNVSNGKNAHRASDNKSGRTGVHFRKRYGLWRAKIGHKGQQIILGEFTTFEEAVKAREVAEIGYGYSPLHGSER